MWPPKFSDCLEACNVARRRCERLVTTALAQRDVNVVATTIVVARDCARIATLTTQLLERGSKYAYPLLQPTIALSPPCTQEHSRARSMAARRSSWMAMLSPMSIVV